MQRALSACFGADASRRMIHAGRRLLFRFRYPADYALSKQKYDVLFGCGTVRWQNIKLVVEELRRSRPDLRLGLAFPGSREELRSLLTPPGVTTIAHATVYTLRLFDTRILYVATPDLPPSSRPPGALVVHSLMSMASLDGIYSDHHFDGFDYILCGGPHHVDSFRSLAARRPALSGTWLLPAGYPKLDLMLGAKPAAQRSRESPVKPTIVYAPTHVDQATESLASLRRHGEAIVDALLAGGYRVIFRPHPWSFADQDRALIDRICELHAGNPGFSLDRSKDYTESYSSADLMVTDISGTGFTFSLTFGRPCIFFAPSAEAELGLTGIQFDSRHRIGAPVRSIDEMIEKSSQLCQSDRAEDIRRFRDEFLFNVGGSAAYIAAGLEDVLSGRERPEWIRL